MRFGWSGILGTAFLLAGGAHASPLGILKSSSAEFFAHNAESMDLTTSEEALWASRGGEGTRGGGDSRLGDLRQRRERLLESRRDFLERLQSVDWPAHSDGTVRAYSVETLLPAQPVKRLGRIKIRFSEACRTAAGTSDAIFVHDAEILCMSRNVGIDAYPQAWSRVLAFIFDRGEIQAVLDALSRAPRTAPEWGAQSLLARLYRMSLPVEAAKLPRHLTESGFASCAIPDDFAGDRELSVAEKGAIPPHFRRHPDGHWIARIPESARYASCR